MSKNGVLAFTDRVIDEKPDIQDPKVLVKCIDRLLSIKADPDMPEGEALLYFGPGDIRNTRIVNISKGD